MLTGRKSFYLVFIFVIIFGTLTYFILKESKKPILEYTGEVSQNKTICIQDFEYNFESKYLNLISQLDQCDEKLYTTNFLFNSISVQGGPEYEEDAYFNIANLKEYFKEEIGITAFTRHWSVHKGGVTHLTNALILDRPIYPLPEGSVENEFDKPIYQFDQNGREYDQNLTRPVTINELISGITLGSNHCIIRHAFTKHPDGSPNSLNVHIYVGYPESSKPLSWNRLPKEYWECVFAGVFFLGQNSSGQMLNPSIDLDHLQTYVFDKLGVNLD